MFKYIKKLNENYKIINLIIEALLISIFLICIDNHISIVLTPKIISIIVVLSIVVVLKFLMGTYKSIIAKHINRLDKYLTITLISIFSYAFYILLVVGNENKLIVSCIVFLCALVFWIIRILIVEFSKADNTLIDLDEIIDKKVNIDEENFKLFKEQEVKYDLLRRSSIINQLYLAITKCAPQENFTIGLNGPWGSGKTTIINNVLDRMEKNKIIDNYIIIHFDPWKYDNKKSALNGLLNQILDSIGYDSNFFAKEVLIQDVLSLIFSSENIKMGNLIIKELEKLNGSIDITNTVNNYLNSNNKKNDNNS